MRQFRLLRAQELLSRGNIEEQIAHGNCGPGAPRDLIAVQDLAPGDLDARSGLLVERPRFEQQARNRGDGRQRLAAKSQRADRQEILHVVQFAGRMPFKCQQSVVAQHAASIVGDADQPPSAVFDLDANTGCARVERILQKLFDDGRRPLDDLARRDLVCDVVRKDPDATHASTLMELPLVYLLGSIPNFFNSSA